MPTKITSTGVTFPDATVQTTAANPAGLVLISTVTASGASTVTVTGFSATYVSYMIIGQGVYPGTADISLGMQINGATSNHKGICAYAQSGITTWAIEAAATTGIVINRATLSGSNDACNFEIFLPNAVGGNGYKNVNGSANSYDTLSGKSTYSTFGGTYLSTSDITSVVISMLSGGNTIYGTLKLYGFRNTV